MTTRTFDRFPELPETEALPDRYCSILTVADSYGPLKMYGYGPTPMAAYVSANRGMDMLHPSSNRIEVWD